MVLKGAELHAELIDGLAAVCGDTVEDVSLEFVEPEAVTLSEPDETTAAEEAPRSAEPAPEQAADPTSEITVSMGPARDAEKEA